MSVWNKKNISKEEVVTLQEKYGVDPITSSILVRRGVTHGKDILYFMEDDLRFQHSPFLFKDMEDVVERIRSAKEEGEKVLIFGDRDVDGITSTTVLFDALSYFGIDVLYRLPSGDDAYGLSMAAVDDFAAQEGSLIITVDCGISNKAEIAHANDLGIEVIVLDHHIPPEELPENSLLIDPKLEDSGYPFKDISGCAVAYKVASALRFSRSSMYGGQAALLNISFNEENETYTLDCIKTRNLVPVGRLQETYGRDPVSIMNSRLPKFLTGQYIFVWDEERTSEFLKSIFGDGMDFSFIDLKKESAKILGKIAELPLSRLMTKSKLAKYGDHEPTEIGGFYNIFVTYINMCLKMQNPDYAALEEKDLQLVALAALADIMPMRNENRIFVNRALDYINAGKIRSGLLELMSKVNLLGKRVTSTDLSWVIVSHLNAAGRLGQPELAAELFLTKDSVRREEVAEKILQLNIERKQLSADAQSYSAMQAKASLPNFSGKLCVVIDERINRGVCGILAGKLVASYDVPSLVVTFVDESTAVGSMRSCRNFDATEFLNSMSDLFISFGGHTFAAGFSLERSRIKEFESRLKEKSGSITLGESVSGIFNVDAEIPPAYLEPTLLDVSDNFEPYGELNPPLLFMTRGLSISDAMLMGKGEKQHLKLILNSGKNKWPALFWNEGERLNRDFTKGDKVDVLFRMERNLYNGMETPQLILSDVKLNES